MRPIATASRWGRVMFAIRPALYALLFVSLSWTSAFFVPSMGLSAKTWACAMLSADGAFTASAVVGTPRATTVTRFAPWKARPKIVLVEAHSDFTDEMDLGPAIIPGVVCLHWS